VDQIRRLENGVISCGHARQNTGPLERRTISLADVDFLVLDEADEMLHMGFIDEVRPS
jgi:ATP-dependent RNA helicase DeaD